MDDATTFLMFIILPACAAVFLSLLCACREQEMVLASDSSEDQKSTTLPAMKPIRPEMSHQGINPAPQTK